MPGGQRKATFVQRGEGAHIAWLDQRLRYLVVGEQTESRFAASITEIPPGSVIGGYVRHRDHVGFYLLSGELTAAVGSRRFSFPAGSFLNVAPGTPHELANRGTDAAEVFVLSAPAGFDEFQFRSGLPLAGSDDEPPASALTDQETVAALAPGYGVEMRPTNTSSRTDWVMRLTLPGEGKRLAVLGDVYRFLAVSEDTAGRYSVWHATLRGESGPPFHSHSREDVAFLVLRGTIAFRMDDNEIAIGPGDFAHFPSGTKHRLRNPAPDPAEVLVIAAPAGLEKLFDGIGQVWHSTDELPPPAEASEFERLATDSPRFGIEIYT